MKFNYLLGAVLWAILGITAIFKVWTPSPVAYGIAALALAFILLISTFEK